MNAMRSPAANSSTEHALFLILFVSSSGGL
jgi:hypothetical protein